jgi:hypothetical protein
LVFGNFGWTKKWSLGRKFTESSLSSKWFITGIRAYLCLMSDKRKPRDPHSITFTLMFQVEDLNDPKRLFVYTNTTQSETS